MKVEIYADIACPWCYIGERRFEQALAEFPGGSDIEVVYRPYQLDPSAPEQSVPMKQHLAKRFGAGASGILDRVTQAAAGEGISMEWDRALAVNTRTAHRLMRLARTEYGREVQHALMHALFAAHFTDGIDVGDNAQLTELAVNAGMDADRVRDYLASSEGETELSAEFDYARQIGITSVPTFIFDEQYAVQGGQPASVFLQVLEEVQRRSEATASVGATEDASSCTDGSCTI